MFPQNLSFPKKTYADLRGLSAFKYWTGKTPNVPEYLAVHKESVDLEIFCPIRDAELTQIFKI